MSDRANLIKRSLAIIWANGGATFGGTSRDLLRGDEPTDLDIYLPRGTESQMDRDFGSMGFEKVGSGVTSGPAYYDYKWVTEALKVDVRVRWAEVTDCDINLVLMYATELRLLYMPQHLKGHDQPLFEVLTNIRLKQFVPLKECPEHRKYRWQKFVDRGWKMLV